MTEKTDQPEFRVGQDPRYTEFHRAHLVEFRGLLMTLHFTTRGFIDAMQHVLPANDRKPPLGKGRD